MRKGFHGESVSEALRTIITPGEAMSFSEIVSEIKKKGDWRDDTIWQNLMAHVKNLIPAKHHWNPREQFLFLRGDGRYEIYDPETHPKIVE
jgi:hypothetical protein